MGYRLFVDDERFPPRDGNEWEIARSHLEAITMIIDKGMPEVISFDHDLGEAQSGHDLAKTIIDYHICGFVTFPENFEYRVHSANPVGAANIKGALDSYMKFLNEMKG